MENFKLKLVQITEHCCDVKTFRFQMSEGVTYKPGQYLVFNLEVGGQNMRKVFSISSSPTEKGYVEFTKKLTSSDFSQALNKAEIGRHYSISLPQGNFIFDGQYEKAAFLSAGVGITPIRSICKYAADMKLASNIILLYSSRTPDYLIFRKDFALMQKQNKNLKVVYTLTHCEQKVESCRTGMIDDEMIRQVIPDYKDRKFFICGPPGMVGSMRSILECRMRLAHENIITENFLGY